jgi:hypothetical protein
MEVPGKNLKIPVHFPGTCAKGPRLMDGREKKQLSERDICTKFITPALAQAGWDLLDQVREEVSFTAGRIIVRGRLLSVNSESDGNIAHYRQDIRGKRNGAPSRFLAEACRGLLPIKGRSYATTRDSSAEVIILPTPHPGRRSC